MRGSQNSPQTFISAPIPGISNTNVSLKMAAMTMSTAISSRAALLKPFNSAKPAQRRLVVRAQDPAAPDPSAVEGEVRQCECSAVRPYLVQLVGFGYCP